jgi:hypothetical protein
MANSSTVKLADVIKFVKEEITQTEEALGFVNSELDSGRKTQFNRVYTRKKAEYEGVLWAYNAVLDIMEGRDSPQPEVTDASPEA